MQFCMMLTNIALKFFRYSLTFLLLLYTTVWAQTTPVKLDQPVAFCVTPLSECTPDKQKPITTTIAYDVSGFKQDENDPITLVYAMPAQWSGQQGSELLVSPNFRNHCFQLDSQRNQTVCTDRELTSIPIALNTRWIYVQNVQGDDTRLIKPFMQVANSKLNQKEVLQARTPVIALAGWYTFLGLAALFQLLTNRNRISSLCVSMMAFSLLGRTISSSHYGFAGLTLFGSYADRQMDYLAIALICIFGIGFYGSLIGERLKRVRFSMLGLYIACGLFILVAPKEYVLMSLQLVLLASLSGLVLLVICVYLAFKALKKRERYVLVTGISVLVTGVLIDLFMQKMGYTFLMGGTGLTPYAFAFETLCQFILIALSNDAAHKEAERLMQETQAQKAEIERKNEELLRLDKLKDQFLANTSHELRTPLTGVIGILEPALFESPSGTVNNQPLLAAPVRKSIQVAIASARRLSSLVNDLLDFSKARQDQVQLYPAPVSVKTTTELVCAMLQPSVVGRSVELINAVPDTITAVHADPNRLQQILFNLLGNAIKFTEQGRIEVRAEQDGKWVRVLVKDSGIGIAPEALERIFVPFEQADASTARKFGGVGLGLAIAKSLVEAHGGTISVTSLIGQGTTFSFTLPASFETVAEDEIAVPLNPIIKDRVAAHEAQIAALPGHDSTNMAPETAAGWGEDNCEEVAAVGIATEGEALRILVVDDEPVNRQALEAQLSALGHTFFEAADGFKALQWIAAQGAPDMLLLDVMMPGMSGYEVLDALRKNYTPAQLPVLLMTAKAQEKDLVEGFARGASDYILKPYSFAEVSARINHHAKLVHLMQAEQRALEAEALAKTQTLLARQEVQYAQSQLQQADKMASLGQLVASVTHEINTPIGAISSSGQSITEALNDALQELPALLQQLDGPTVTLFLELIGQANTPKAAMSSREERAVVKKTTEQLDANGIDQARQKAIVLVNLNAHTDLERYLPLLQHSQTEKILQTASNVAIAINGAKNVNLAVERVTKIVKALKSFSHFNVGTEKIEANLLDGMETVLTIYQGQTKVGVEVVRNYEDTPLLNCFPDELNQVWTNLIHNALQAMNYEGTLTIGIKQENDNAVVSVGDSGCGIPEDIRGKIFDVFFTTKPAGVGSGLGLDIVKKIIDKHHGRIDVQSEVGVGTIFTVTLPYKAPIEIEDLQD